jgi:hypothetical protein
MERENPSPVAVGVVGAIWSRRGIHAELWTLRWSDVGTVGFNAPLIVLDPPLVKERLDSVSSGPSTYPPTDPNAVGSYCMTKPFFIEEKSMLLLIKNLPKNVVEPAFVEVW